MDEIKWFMHRIKHTGGDSPAWDKGIEIHDTLDAAIQSYHAYLAYGFNNPKFPDVDYVACEITDMYGDIVAGHKEVWKKG